MTQSPAPSDPARRARSNALLPPAALTGVVAALLAVGFMAFFTYQTLKTRELAASRVTLALEVIQQFEAFLSSVKDAETGQRGYLLTGEERYLEPFTTAAAAIPAELSTLRRLLGDRPQQIQRLEVLQQLATDKIDELAQTVAMSRAGDAAGATALVRTDRGKATMDRIRTLVAELEGDERQVLAMEQAAFQDAVVRSSQVTWGGAALLIVLIALAAITMSGDFRSRETQVWLRTGQIGLSQRMQGEQRLETLGENVLSFLAGYMNAQVGAAYVADGKEFRRIAGFALPSDARDQLLRPGDGLVGQAAKENRTLHVTDVPDGYLPVASSVGRSRPSELLVAPGTFDGRVQAIIELGFFGRVRPEDRELLPRVSEALGVAVRASKDRTRLEELLSETQQQGEELQTQQEELRVSNEELEEQGRVLRESRARLETQQTELEQINANLEEQTHLLELQKDELSRTQRILIDKAGELERANQYKSEFMANMSHELRTPLNSLLILAKLLADNKEENLTGEQVKYAQTISSAGSDLLVLINDILDLAKIEAGKVDLVREPIQLARTVDALVKALQPLARQKGLSLSGQVEPAAPERITTDGQRLGQILRNLLANAVKFTDKGEVSLRVRPAGSAAIAFEVRDTGIGIDVDQQSIIFEAFRQADGSTHRKFGGTGLGLSISKNLARALGGDISLESAPGHGSVFTLTLPTAIAVPAGEAGAAMAVHESPAGRIAGAAAEYPTPGPQPPAVTVEPSKAPDHPMTNARRLLVIEDDVRFAAILCDVAHERGFESVVAHAAEEGLRLASTVVPHAIVLDMKLPDHSGLAVLDQLKRNTATRHIPVHVISVSDYSQQALERGAIGYALKPVEREQVLEAFRRLEDRLSPGPRRVLVVDDDDRQRESIDKLLGSRDVEIVGVGTASDALAKLKTTTFDCVVMDLTLPDMGGGELLEQMAEQDDVSFPPVIVYTGRLLTPDEEHRLRRFSKSIIIKDARSPERLLDEVTLFLHQVEATLPAERQRMLRAARDRETALEGRRILVVEDDARNIFALSSVLEPKGVRVEIARNGREALDALAAGSGPGAAPIDLVLMDIMMPEMDGLTAIQEIRKRVDWKKLPIIALTAKAMKDDQERCLAAGANDYIAKPLDVEKLLSLVRVWMPK